MKLVKYNFILFYICIIINIMSLYIVKTRCKTCTLFEMSTNYMWCGLAIGVNTIASFLRSICKALSY